MEKPSRRQVIGRAIGLGASSLVGRQARAGWEPTASSYFFSGILPAVAAVRLFRRVVPGRSRRSDLELSPPAVGRALELVMRAEAALIERGVRLPAGVSVGMACTAR